MESYKILIVSFILWGVAFELSYSSTSCIFQDSVPRQRRTDYMTYRAIIECVANAAGPGVQLLYFLIVDDTWSLQRCKWVLIVGTLVWSPIASANLFFFDDPRKYVRLQGDSTLSTDTDSIAESNISGITANSFNDITASTTAGPSGVFEPSTIEDDSTEGVTVQLDEIAGIGDQDVAIVPEVHEQSLDQARLDEQVRRDQNERNILDVHFASQDDADAFARLTRARKWAPLIIACTDVFRAIGSGMSVRFFTLFFINDYGFSPVQTSALSMFYLLGIACLTDMANKVSKRIGRAEASISFQAIGIILLIALVKLRNIYIVVIVFLLRGAFANGCSTIDRAMVSDYTKTSQRGKYNAIESINSVTWCGSAVIGGIISDKTDYRFSFVVTAGVYTIGLLFYCPVLFLLPQDKPHKQDDEETDSQLSQASSIVMPNSPSPVRASNPMERNSLQDAERRLLCSESQL
eukprot:Selendium_serpulae@DN5375_c0_g1_i1.p1